MALPRAALLSTGFAGKLWPTQFRRFSDEFLTNYDLVRNWDRGPRAGTAGADEDSCIEESCLTMALQVRLLLLSSMFNVNIVLRNLFQICRFHLTRHLSVSGVCILLFMSRAVTTSFKGPDDCNEETELQDRKIQICGSWKSRA